MRRHRAENPGAEAQQYREDRDFRVKRRARARVQQKVRRGTLAPEPCETCGSQKAQAHHDDYDFPLEVRWLCAGCHGEAHYPAAARAARNAELQLPLRFADPELRLGFYFRYLGDKTQENDR